MMKLPILDTFRVTGRGTALVIECPGDCPRSLAGFKEAFGSTIVYEGGERLIVGLESHALNAPLKKGERISLLV